MNDELPSSDSAFRIPAHQPLGQIIGLDVEEPVPGEGAPGAGDIVEQVMLRNDVEDGGALHLFGMIEAQGDGDAGAAYLWPAAWN